MRLIRLIGPMRFLLFAFLFCAAPLWSDTLLVYATFLPSQQPNCTSSIGSLSEVNCTTRYDANTLAGGEAQFIRLDDSHFEFKGLVNLVSDTPALNPVVEYDMLISSLQPAFEGNYVVTNIGQLPGNLYYTTLLHQSVTNIMPGSTASIYHDSSTRASFELGNWIFAPSTSGSFDFLVADTPVPEPASFGLLWISGLLLTLRYRSRNQGVTN